MGQVGLEKLGEAFEVLPAEIASSRVIQLLVVTGEFRLGVGELVELEQDRLVIGVEPVGCTHFTGSLDEFAGANIQIQDRGSAVGTTKCHLPRVVHDDHVGRIGVDQRLKTPTGEVGDLVQGGQLGIEIATDAYLVRVVLNGLVVNVGETMDSVGV